MSLLSPSNSSPTASDRADPFPPIYGGGCGRSVVRTSARKQSEGGHPLKPRYLSRRDDNRRIFLNIARVHRHIVVSSSSIGRDRSSSDVLDEIAYIGILCGRRIKVFFFLTLLQVKKKLTRTTRKHNKVLWPNRKVATIRATVNLASSIPW